MVIIYSFVGEGDANKTSFLLEDVGCSREPRLEIERLPASNIRHQCHLARCFKLGLTMLDCDRSTLLGGEKIIAKC
jgi:hypothetical protein